MLRAYIINPQNNKGAWFSFPLYFGKLRKIGHSGSYEDSVEVVVFENVPFECHFSLRLGYYNLYELERLNAEVEGHL
ncbi:hypothetical protein KUF89_01800 [Streptococcus equi subsp. zooepidemicus]|uniref:hypothetical protein n=1 Tax=Streptococcus equi TaxID=1336 RepID=UPI001E2B7B18|nr:hypothetical protein [Streptococcus equi]MCD3380017.1 hypothetical protein [Streptococcus equi subsp. zooepidemicus]MCD3409318.1 hypothetical protein [Streptococcus equi subsp. zooepidemicus]HEL0663244.1 hypothetical protein [Streptococcus equi subsp. zooepidemicus]